MTGELEASIRIRALPELGLAITGATGYVGSSVVKLMAKVVKPVANLAELDRETVLIHLAAMVEPSNPDCLVTNLSIDLQALRLANSRSMKFVYASTNNIYPRALACDAATAPVAQDFYSASKIFGEHLVRLQRPSGWCILRIADVFGAGQRHGNFFRAAETALRARAPISVFGGGFKTRSYIYIEELVSVIRHVADLVRQGQDDRRIFNVCHADPMAICDIADRLGSLGGVPVERLAQADDRSHLDIRTMVQTTIPGYRYRFGMEEALQRYVASVTGG